MKTLISYYSFSGNTDKVAKVFAGELKSKGEVDIQRIHPQAEIREFVVQCRAAFTRKRAVLDGGLIFDVSQYDLVMIGSPVWAFAPTPAMNTYLDKISGLEGKRVIIFLTSGSGLGVKNCFNSIRAVLNAKGAARIDEINIKDKVVTETEQVLSALRGVI